MTSVISLLGAFLVSLSLPLHAVLACLLVFFALTLQLRLKILPSLFACFLGISLVTLPIFGSGTLLLFTLLAISTQPYRANPVKIGGPYLGLLAAWTVSYICISNLELAEHFSIPRLVELFESIKSAPPKWYSQLVQFLRVLIIFSLASIVMSSRIRESGRQTVKTLGDTLKVAAVSAAILSVVQISNLFPQFFHNQNAFWNAVGRPVGSFTDPNAFGLSAFFFIGLLNAWQPLVRRDHLFKIGLIIIWLALGLLSGSRTFLVGIILLFSVSSYLHRPRMLLRLILGVLVLVLVLDLCRESSPTFYNSIVTNLPPGIARICNSVTILGWASAIYSRMVFWQLGLEIFKDNWLIGIGPENFRYWVLPYSQELFPEISSWTDNSNNFYLGILAETGILGATLFFLTVSAWKFREVGSKWTILLVSFAILLLLGPHLNFDEVAILFGIVLGLSLKYEPRNLFRKAPTWFIAAPISTLVFINVYFADTGWFNWELGEGGLLRWSQRYARSTAQCSPELPARLGARDVHYNALLEIRALNPDLSTSPLIVDIKSPMEQLRIELNDSNFIKVLIKCGFSTDINYSILTSRTWQPANYGMGADLRNLGIQQRIQSIH